jgi:hypothetical protein
MSTWPRFEVGISRNSSFTASISIDAHALEREVNVAYIECIHSVDKLRYPMEKRSQ